MHFTESKKVQLLKLIACYWKYRRKNKDSSNYNKKGHKELFNINKFSSKNKVSFLIGKLKKWIKKSENKISYWQMTYFK